MTVDGFELAYDRAGRGPAVVLLHGWPGERTDDRIDAFFSRARLRFVDGAGH
jgi:pimeloyl-ACP methyl ester carboxylesterase